MPGTVRVVLASQSQAVKISINGDYQLIDQSTSRVVARLEPNENWQVRLIGNQIELKGSKTNFGPFQGPVIIRELEHNISLINGEGKREDIYSLDQLSVVNGRGQVVPFGSADVCQVRSASGVAKLTTGGGKLNLVTLTGEGTFPRRYRGSMEFLAENGGLIIVNELNIEDYLRGVVPSEMPASWPLEALKAQAVAARNFALQRAVATRGQTYNLTMDQSTQVYKGYDAETAFTNRAIDDTRGMVMLCGGNLVSAFFHSCSGGVTENSEDVWSQPIPYIIGKQDPFDRNDRHYDWQVRYTAGQLAEQLNKAGYSFNKVTDLMVIGHTSSNQRVVRLGVKGTGFNDQHKYEEIFNSDRVRRALGLKSSMFIMQIKYENNNELSEVMFNGSGWGHGAGLSQWGAFGMASQGYNYQEILKYYYTGVILVSGYGRLSGN